MERSAAEAMARAEDTRVGRVVPNWRYQLEFLLVLAAYLAGRFVEGAGTNVWVNVGVLFVALFAHALILGPHRRRSLR